MILINLGTLYKIGLQLKTITLSRMMKSKWCSKMKLAQRKKNVENESNVEESVQEPALDDLELEPDSSDNIGDDEMPPTVTRKDILNQVDLDEALQMEKKSHEM